MKFFQSCLKFCLCLTVILIARFAAAELNEKELAKDIVKVIDRLRWSDRCESFAQSSHLGSWGKHILLDVNRAKYPELYRGTPDFKVICPAYDQLRDQEKDYVWVMALTAMAFYESSCKTNATATGPNGTAYGLMQLHSGQENRYAEGCVRGDARRPMGTLTCTLSMLNEQIRREQRMFSPRSYWEVLRPRGRSDKAKKVAWSLMLFPLCQDARRGDQLTTLN